MAADPYQTLGVERTASHEDISKAYRDLARKYHPDLNPDDETAKKKFQEIQSAFDILSDEKKRKMFDRYGAGFESMGGGGGAGPQGWPGAGGGGAGQFDFDLNDLFGGGAPGAGGPQGGGGFADLFKHFGGAGTKSGQPPQAQRGADLEYELTVPFNTAVNGGEASVALRRGNGKHETISVKIPAGIEDGKKIRLRGQGEQSPMGGQAGDILITVRVASHPYFTRNGRRLDVTAPITLAEAVEGAKIDVPTPRGTIAVTIPPGTSGGKRLRLRGQGVKPATGEPGDLYVEVQIVLPNNLTDQQRSQLVDVAKTDTRNPREELRW